MTSAQIQGQAMMMAGLFELILALMSGLMIFNWRRAARGTLDRNAYVGIRLPSTLRSQEAWVAANRVAFRSAPVYLLFNIGMCAALFVAAGNGWRLVVAFIGGVGLFVLIILLSCTAFFANKAADAVGDRTRSPLTPPPRR
jgi:uncharacterized membrane protein